MYAISEPMNIERDQNDRYFCYNNQYVQDYNNDSLSRYTISNMPQPLLSWTTTPPASVDSNDSRNILSPSSSSGSSSYDVSIYNCQELSNAMSSNNFPGQPYMKIVEQPVEGFRFRYKSEMTGTHGALGGASSTRSKKNCFPTVQLVNFDKPAEIRCSLYQVGPEERRQPHAHRLVMKVGNTERDDPHSIAVSMEKGYEAIFSGMGILHTARSNVVAELVRKKIAARILVMEQHGKGLNKMEEVKIKNEAETMAKTINLNVVCLRFDAYAKDSNGVLVKLCEPVYSNKINNLKSALTGDLKIVRFSEASCPANGNSEIFMLVEKVTKKNIKIRFYQLDERENEVWSDYGRFNDIDVHHQYAIVFRTPAYKNLNIDKRVSVLMELERPSDGARSEAKEFVYTPCDNFTSRKRPRTEDSSSNSFELPISIDSLNEDLNDIHTSELVDMFVGRPDITSDEFVQLLSSNIGQSYSRTFEDTIVVEPQSAGITVVGGGGARAQDHLTTIDGGDAIPPPPKTARTPAPQKTHISVPMPTQTELSRLKERSMQESIKMIFGDLISMFRSKPSLQKIQDVLRSNIEQPLNENGDTIIHVSILYNLLRQLSFLFNLMKSYKLLDLIDTMNKQKMTPFHIAAAMKNFSVIRALLVVGAKSNVQDNIGNTPLHLALRESAQGNVLETLLLHSKPVINNENNDADVPLFIAVRTGNAEAVTGCIKAGSDINKRHKTTGYSALHIAVAEKNVDIVQILLKSHGLNVLEDFSGCNPIRQAHLLHDPNSESSTKILKLLEEYAAKNNISYDMKSEIYIKQEIEDDTDETEVRLQLTEEDDEEEEEEEQTMVETKVEIFERQHIFTADCLEKLSVLLDESKLWTQLAELLDHKIFLKHNLFHGVSSPSRALLEYCMDSGDSVIQIRNFLERLDALDAVQVIDEMIENHR